MPGRRTRVPLLFLHRLPHDTEGREGRGLNFPMLLAISSFILAVSRSFDGLKLESGVSPYVSALQPDALMTSLSRHTHYMPSHWRGRGHTREVDRDHEAHTVSRRGLLMTAGTCHLSQVYQEFRQLYQCAALALALALALDLALTLIMFAGPTSPIHFLIWQVPRHAAAARSARRDHDAFNPLPLPAEPRGRHTRLHPRLHRGRGRRPL